MQAQSPNAPNYLNAFDSFMRINKPYLHTSPIERIVRYQVLKAREICALADVSYAAK